MPVYRKGMQVAVAALLLAALLYGLNAAAPVPTNSASNASATTHVAPECNLTGVVNGYGTIQFYDNATGESFYPFNNTYQFPCGTTIILFVTTNQNFNGWTCAGTGCYAGLNYSTTIVLNSNVAEAANFGNVSAVNPTLNSTAQPPLPTAPPQNATTAYNGTTPIVSQPQVHLNNTATPPAVSQNSSLISNLILVAVAVVDILAIAGLVMYIRRKPAKRFQPR